MTHHKKDIGSVLDVRQQIPIQNVDATTGVNGTSYDRTTNGMPGSAVAIASIGSATGTPSAQTHRFALEESADNSSWAAATDDDGNAITLDVTADDTTIELDINLMPCERYVRLSYDETNSSFTAGTSPTNDISAALIFGGFESRPQNN